MGRTEPELPSHGQGKAGPSKPGRSELRVSGVHGWTQGSHRDPKIPQRSHRNFPAFHSTCGLGAVGRVRPPEQLWVELR